MRAADLLDRLEDRPFTPFRIHLSDGTLFEVTDPGLMLVGLSSAIVPTRFGRDEEGRRLVRNWRTAALSHIVQLSDLDDHGHGNGRRRKAS
jgi:hypothetical protein